MKNWINHLALVVFLITLFSLTIYYRGNEAIRGVTWGKEELLCQFNMADCSIDMKLASVKLGMYDPLGVYQSSNLLAVDHYFISLISKDQKELLADLKNTTDKNRWALVSVEPWNREGENAQTLLTDIATGKYDQEIMNICSGFQQFDKPLFIRFGHEMENNTGRYPWATADSQLFIGAYRYFVNSCKSTYKKGFYVWSPAGNQGLENYYPGDDVVDYIGVSIYGLPVFDKDVYGHFRTFRENFTEKYERVKKYNKPIMIAEMGITGSSSSQKKWLKAALEHTEQFPLLKMVVYFNSKDNAGAWDQKYGIPDWSIDKSVLWYK